MQKTFLALVAISLLAGCAPHTTHEVSYGSMENLAMVSSAKSRSVSPENFTGEKGKAGMATQGTGANAARELGQGWKISPSVRMKSGTTFTLANITGPGFIEHIWMTPTGNWKKSILRVYWDNETVPAIECPAGDFFACGLQEYSPVNSLAVCVNPRSGLNCYWKMPFRKSARITMENTDAKDMTLYYQIDYALADVASNAGYLHAKYHREDPLKEEGIYTILDGIKGRGQYVGTYMVYESHTDGWWGEGEIKFFIDGDQKFPTIAGTGTEDYFCGSYDFVVNNHFTTFSSPYTGLSQVIPPDLKEKANQKFSLYRWHIADPIRFEKDLKVTIQDLGWQQKGLYRKLSDTISTVAYWYQIP